MEKQPQIITQDMEINRLYQNNYHINDIMETKIPFSKATTTQTYEMLEIYLIKNINTFTKKIIKTLPKNTNLALSNGRHF